jgi:phosphotransferase system HPr (HPr) family protein
MTLRELTLVNQYGLHLRPASKFVDVAVQYESEIFVSVEGGEEGNGKSILDFLARAAGKGAKLTIRAEGEDSEQAVEALSALVESGFGELTA